VPAPRNLTISGPAPVTHDEPPAVARDPGKLRPEGLTSGGEPACRPGSVTPLSVTWQHSPKCWLTCDFTSHGATRY
jgi:hypothetical protein